jgi:hypothetical protein
MDMYCAKCKEPCKPIRYADERTPWRANVYVSDCCDDYLTDAVGNSYISESDPRACKVCGRLDCRF